MELVEIRDLDGPNPLLLEPTIKLEWRLVPADLTGAALADLARRLEPLGVVLEESDSPPGDRLLDALGDRLVEAALALHRRAGAHPPDCVWRRPELPEHLVVAYGWQRRAFALALARQLDRLASGQTVEAAASAELSNLLAAPATPTDQPRLIRDADRRIPIVAVTGTNGKTTTTRLIAHILRETGRRVGWCTTAGVYVDGELVEEGDYSGPGGARRVLAEPGLDAAVLETARGGILLRGLGYEHNDVGVFINISADHLGLQGILTLEGLARVKATVVRVTRPGGYAVLNADDRLVRGAATDLEARPFFVSRVADNPWVVQHVAAGGRALFVDNGTIVHANEGQRAPLAPLADVPVTFGGRAPHMIENALYAAAACLALDLTPAQVAAGLASFRNTPEQNFGRLNVWAVNGATIVVDYAHNEAGLDHLLAFARSYVALGGRLIAVIGTAGDRPDEVLRAMGAMAARRSDLVLIKETKRYLRTRATAAEMNEQFRAGIEEAGGRVWRIEPGEAAALEGVLAEIRPGDAVAFSSFEQMVEVRQRLAEVGRMIS